MPRSGALAPSGRLPRSRSCSSPSVSFGVRAVTCSGFDRYSESLALHVGLLFLALRYVESRSSRDLSFVAYDGYLPDTLARVEALRKNEKKPRREPLLLGMGLCPEWQYYTLVHPGGPELLEELKPLFQTRCVHEQKFPEVARNAIASSSRVFAVVKEPVSEDLMKLKADSGKPLRVTRRSALGGYRILMIDRPAR